MFAQVRRVFSSCLCLYMGYSDQEIIFLVVSGVTASIATTISVVNIYRHLKTWVRPRAQKNITRILFVVPIYGIIGFISLLLPTAALYLETVRDVYEAYVIYLFLDLMIAFAGGDSMCASDLSNQGTMKHPWPLCCLSPIRLGERFLRRCKIGALQFVIGKPIMAVFSIVMLSANSYRDPWYQTLLTVTYNVMYSIALIALFYLYLAVRPLVLPYHPLRKFMAVKIVVFLTYWQSVAVFALPVETTTLQRLDDMILCVEMTIFAILHYYAFNPAEFMQIHQERSSNLDRDDEPQPGVLTNIVSVLSMRDLSTDVKQTFSDKTAPLEQYRGVQLLEVR